MLVCTKCIHRKVHLDNTVYTKSIQKYTKYVHHKAYSGSTGTIQKVYKKRYFLYTTQFQIHTTKCIPHKCTKYIQCDVYLDVKICTHFV